MKTIRNFTLYTLHFAFAFAAVICEGAIPISWEVRPGNPTPASFDRYHGETIDFSCILIGFGSDNQTVFGQNDDIRLWFQTNGMGHSWWSAPANVSSNVITATWSPSLDPGADRVLLFFGAPSNVYASAILRLRHSPGYAPGVLPLPTQSLDFADVTVFNAPWPAEIAAAVAPVAAAVANAAIAATNYTNASTQDLARVGSVLPARRYETSPDWYVDSEVHFIDSVDFETPYNYFQNGLYFSGGESYRLSEYGVETPDGFAEWPIGVGRFALMDDIPPEPDLSDYATHAQATNAARAVSAPLEENVGVLWQYVLGDTVWFAVTNYMRTVEGVVPSLQLWEVRNGATNLVYHSTEEITNVVASAAAKLRTEITNAMPSKAWSRYQSATGAENPQPGEITIVSTPSIMMTGGGEWNRYVHTGGSSVWVLRSSGLTTFGGGADGAFFSVEDDEGVAQFEIRRTDSYEVDALPSETGFSGEDFQVTYNLPATGNPPTLYASTNLATTAFAAEENGSIDSLGITVNWAAYGGLWRATIVQDVKAPALFVHAKALQEGSVVVRNNAPTALSGGIYIGNTKYTVGTAVISGHTVLTLTPAP